MVFVDTPGLHNPRHKLGEYLNQEARDALDGVDAVLWLVDSTTDPSEDDERIASLLPRRTPLVLASQQNGPGFHGCVWLRAATAYQALLPREAEILNISATRGQGLPDLLTLLGSLLPAREPEFDAEQVTDLYEKEIAADLIREAALVESAR